MARNSRGWWRDCRRKLTGKKRDEILGHLESGCYLVEAASAAGIPRDMLSTWIKRGERRNTGKYCDFVNAVRKKRAEVQRQILEVIQEAAIGDWRAAAWLLEHGFKDT